MRPAAGVFVGIMAKAPRAGHAKTRLAHCLSPDVAADLYRHFLLDTVETLRRVEGITAGFVCPPGDGPALAALGAGLPIVEQAAPGLMAGLAFGIDRSLAAGYRAAILINGDSPTLPRERIVEAIGALAGHDVVLGPTTDGGYYLIGATVSCTTLLCAEPYPDGATIYADTLDRARQLALRVAAIAPWFDVDLPSELQHLALTLQDLPDHVAAHTRRALTTHGAAIRALSGG